MKLSTVIKKSGIGILIVGILLNPSTSKKVYAYENQTLTRGKAASIISEIFRPTPEEYILATDVNDIDWHKKAMGDAVAMGFYMDAQFMRPAEPITRQELFTALSRVFEPGKPESLDVFWESYPDFEQVQEWAREGTASILQAVPSIANKGMIEPTRPATKAELNFLLKTFAGTVINSPGKAILPETQGNVVISCDGVILKNQTVFGDLILTEGIKGSVTLENVTIIGKILNRAGDNVVLCGT